MTAVTESAATAAAAPSSPRVAFLDNARFWTMVLVVIGHPLLHFISLDSGRAIYYWMYLFTMPVFAMLSGYISRNFRGTPKEIQRAVSTLVIPYLLVESAYQLLQRHYTGQPDPYMLLSPKWVAWFLAALFVWRLTTPIWRSLRHPILVSITISLLVPLTEVPNVFALPKALGMLPFYVVGMYLTLDRFERLAAVRVRVASALFLAGVAVASAMFSPHWDISWTKWRHRYGEAALGERTLYCYLLHGFVVYFIVHETHLFATLRDMGTLGLVITIIGGGALALALMTKPVAVLFKPLFEADLSWAFTQRERLPK